MTETKVKHIEYVQIANLHQHPSLELTINDAIKEIEANGGIIKGSVSISSVISSSDPCHKEFDIVITYN